MTRAELVALCLTFPGAYEDYPFHDGNWTVMRHKSGKKTFALVYERGGALCVNIKCEPMQAEFLRKIYKAVTPGYHMNKTHWNTVTIGMDVGDEALLDMLEDSYALTAPRKKKN